MLLSVRNMKFSSGEDIEASAKAVFAPSVITRSFNNKCDAAVSRLCGWTNFPKLARACHGRLTPNSGSVGTIFFTGLGAQTAAANADFERIRWAFGRCGRERGGAGA